MNRAITFILIFFAVMTVSAQRKVNTAKATKANKTEQLPDPRIERMISATQNVIFIDSIVVDKNAFLNKYRLNPEAGSLQKYNDFFNSDDQPNSYVYVNELGEKCYYSIENYKGEMKLYTSDFMNDAWTSPELLKGIYDDEKYTSLNFPFMMADGCTLYFAAKGTESIGGYDIFMTRFDSETGQYFTPENIGMPFNSTANDYMYAIDELDSIGWFATDRNQKEGKVCIYMFIPSDTHQAYSPDEYTEEQIQRFSRIDRIANTWGDNEARTRALERLRSINPERKRQKRNGSFCFVINDNTTYTKLSDFKSTDNANKFWQLQTIRQNMASLANALEKARTYYATANVQEKKKLKAEIIASEQKYENMERQVMQTEKDIRNVENNLLK